jgi:hypothetical protein
MNFQTLLDELQTDPLGLGYAPKSDRQRFDLLTAKTRTKNRFVPIGEFSQWLTVSGVRFKLKAGERNQQTTNLVRDYIDVVFGLERNPHITVVDPAAAGAIVTGLLQAGVVGQDDVNALNALFSVPVSRAEELGLTGLGLGHLESAREQVG